MLYLNEKIINNADYTIQSLAEQLSLDDCDGHQEQLTGAHVEMREQDIIQAITGNKLKCHKLGKEPVDGESLSLDDITFTQKNVEDWLVKNHPKWKPSFIFDSNTTNPANEDKLVLDTALKCIGALWEICCEPSIKHEQPPFNNQDEVKETIAANHPDGLVRGLSARNLDRYLKAGKEKIK